MKTLLTIALLLTTSVCVGQSKIDKNKFVGSDSSVGISDYEIGDFYHYKPPVRWNIGIDDTNCTESLWHEGGMPYYISKINCDGTVKDYLYYSPLNDSLWLADELKGYLMIGIKLWDIYAKECYADSTRLVYRGYPTLKHKRGSIWYFHRVPTLEGFVEFLRRKMK